MDQNDKGPPRHPKGVLGRLAATKASTLLMGVLVAFVALGIATVGGSTPTAFAYSVTICHATNSATNPYVKITVDDDAVDGAGANDHTSHTGTVATSNAHAQQLKGQGGWGDIIPEHQNYPSGLNVPAGQTILDNDCEFVTPPTMLTLTLVKECEGAETGSFIITVRENATGEGVPPPVSRTIACGASSTVSVVSGVEYIVEENPPAGWLEPSIRGSCDGDGTVTLPHTSNTCVITNTAEEQTATLTVTKECVGGTGGTFTIAVTGEGSNSYPCGQSRTFEVEAGVEHTVSETPPAGWTGPNIRGLCDGDGTFTLAPGGSGTCVVQNVAEEQTATLIVTKECIGTDDGSLFTINVSPGGMSTDPLGCGDSEQFTVDANTLYTVSETPPSGWSGPNIRGLCDGDGTLEVPLEPGETGTCVVQNVAEEQTATLFIEKECIGPDDGTLFTINVSGGIGPVVLGCGATSDPITVDANTLYTVSETPPAGWTGPNIRGLCDGDGTFEVPLEPDETGTCVVQNVAEEQFATLIVTKECIGTDDGTLFTISVSGFGSDSYGCGDSQEFEVEAGVEYTVSETAPDGWDGPNIRGACDGDGTVTLQADETGTCVVQNVAEELASVSASKACSPGADESATFTFTLYDASDDSVVDTAIVSCGDIASFEGLEAGDYYVLESDIPAGFSQDASGTNCDQAFTVDPNEDASCTITNIEQQGVLPPAAPVESEVIIVEVQPEAQPPAAPVEATAVAEVQGVTQVITPPSTGDGGLADDEHSRGFMTPLLMLAGVTGLVTALSVRRLRHLKRR